MSKKRERRWDVRAFPKAIDSLPHLYPLMATQAKAKKFAQKLLLDSNQYSEACVIDTYDELPLAIAYMRVNGAVVVQEPIEDGDDGLIVVRVWNGDEGRAEDLSGALLAAKTLLIEVANEIPVDALPPIDQLTAKFTVDGMEISVTLDGPSMLRLLSREKEEVES